MADPALPVTGWSGREAKARLARYGPNHFRERQERSLLLQYLTRFKDPLVVILLVASAVSAFTGESVNFLIIAGIVLLSVTLDSVQEYEANAAAEKLRQSASVRTLVMRDGSAQEVAITERVPGALVVLSAGDRIPAGGGLLEAHGFFVKQAQLTGESHPTEKRPGTSVPS
jgi:Mg2+-importing ATPase